MKEVIFPTWRFHKKLKPEGKIIYSKEEFEKLGPGWVDSPAAFEESNKVEKDAEAHKAEVKAKAEAEAKPAKSEKGK